MLMCHHSEITQFGYSDCFSHGLNSVFCYAARMVGRAKTQRQQNKAAADFKETWMLQAIEIYHQEQQAKPSGPSVISVTAQMANSF